MLGKYKKSKAKATAEAIAEQNYKKTKKQMEKEKKESDSSSSSSSDEMSDGGSDCEACECRWFGFYFDGEHKELDFAAVKMDACFDAEVEGEYKLKGRLQGKNVSFKLKREGEDKKMVFTGCYNAHFKTIYGNWRYAGAARETDHPFWLHADLDLENPEDEEPEEEEDAGDDEDPRLLQFVGRRVDEEGNKFDFSCGNVYMSQNKLLGYGQDDDGEYWMIGARTESKVWKWVKLRHRKGEFMFMGRNNTNKQRIRGAWKVVGDEAYNLQNSFKFRYGDVPDSDEEPVEEAPEEQPEEEEDQLSDHDDDEEGEESTTMRWSGHYWQNGSHEMAFDEFSFGGGEIAAAGSDDAGDFEIKGQVKGMRVVFKKKYEGYTIVYKGWYRQSQKCIYGTW